MILCANPNPSSNPNTNLNPNPGGPEVGNHLL